MDKEDVGVTKMSTMDEKDMGATKSCHSHEMIEWTRKPWQLQKGAM
jgi:hypothetical protein